MSCGTGQGSRVGVVKSMAASSAIHRSTCSSVQGTGEHPVVLVAHGRGRPFRPAVPHADRTRAAEELGQGDQVAAVISRRL